MTDWATISSIATAAGTLVLAVATFSSVRSGNRAARVAERSMVLSLRPVLVHARDQDPVQEVTWADGPVTNLPPGRAVIEEHGENLYISLAVRNAGSGVAVLQAAHVWADPTGLRQDLIPAEQFHTLTRDIYVSPGDVGFWQGAIRPGDDRWPGVREAVAEPRRFGIDLLYGDVEGGQPTVTRFGVWPPEDGGSAWVASAARHWRLEGDGPRD